MRFADLDRNRNGQIERTEWRGSPRSFAIHDWNGDGVLSGDEVRAGAVPPAGSLEADDYNMSAGDRFSYLDVNNNGSIDRNEWDGSLDTFYQLDRNNDSRITRAELNQGRRTTFAALDANGDGRINLGEWGWSHRSFDDMDTNKDGVITRDEFRSGAVPTTGTLIDRQLAAVAAGTLACPTRPAATTELPTSQLPAISWPAATCVVTGLTLRDDERGDGLDRRRSLVHPFVHLARFDEEGLAGL